MNKPNNKLKVNITSQIIINSSKEKAFEYIIPIDLKKIFKRYKYFPAVISTSNKKRWYTPGMSRTVYFDNGTEAKETLLTVTPYKLFTYKIENFTFALKYLASGIEGKWLFEEDENNHVKINWTYTVTLHNLFTKTIFILFVSKDMSNVLQNGLELIKKELN